MQPIEWVYVLIFTAMIFSSTLWLILYMSRRDEVHSDPDPPTLPSVTFPRTRIQRRRIRPRLRRLHLIG